MEVVWRGAALDDLIAIADYLAPLDPAAASRIVNAIERAPLAPCRIAVRRRIGRMCDG